MSARIPFGLFLNVGGNRENSEKKMVSPEAASPSRVMVNELFVFAALDVGLSVTKNLVQLVAEAPETSWEDEASTVPSSATSDAVRLPLKVEPSANLKLTEALYVQDSSTLIPIYKEMEARTG